MEPALKQRLIGAAVLVAIAVIFLPMLIKGPAPESGISDVPLDIPDAPPGEFETRELPLVTPAGTAGGSVTGMQPRPVGDDAAPAANPGADGGMFPAPTAGGGYAVSFGSYASTADAARVVDALVSSQLPGYRESFEHDGRTLHRVRIGPYDSRATAEAARLRAAHVRDDVGSRVLAIDGDDGAAATASTAAPAPEVEPTPAEPLPEPPSRPVADSPAPKPAAEPTVAEPAAPARTAPPPPAAADVGFAVQLGAFSTVADANALRDRARAAGFNAFIQQVDTDKGPLSRVQVGPVTDRTAAEQLKAQVAARLGVNGFVHSHP